MTEGVLENCRGWGARMSPGDTRRGAGAGYPALKRRVYSLEGDKTYTHEASQYSPPEHKATCKVDQGLGP